MINNESCKQRVYVNQSVIRTTPKTKIVFCSLIRSETATSYKLLRDHIFDAVTIRGGSYQGEKNVR